MSSIPFKVGGPLTDDDAVYIERKADREALTHMRAMDYLLVIEPRQQGKTSLINQLMRHPLLNDMVFAYVDATTPDRSTEATWYQSLCPRILRQLRSFIPRTQWPTIPQNSAKWRDLLCEVATLAADAHQCAVIALDEIGAVTFPGATEFFSVLRDVYNSRQAEIELKQLIFLLAGAFHPRDLIKDDKVSPFNIAQRVRLTDFTVEQVSELVGKGGWPDEQATALAGRIHYWTDGQPYLTQLLCSYLGPDATPADVDTGVERLRREDENHLSPLLKRLNSDRKLCEYVGRIQASERIKFYPGENRQQAQLELLGVLKADDNGYCAIRNRIYEQALTGIDEFHYDAFISYSHRDSAWVRDALLPYLEQKRLRVCIDYRDFEPGAPSLNEMERSISQSRKTLLVLTPDYLASEWAEFENTLAATLDPAARERRVIPLLLKQCELPLRIRALTHLDFTELDESQFHRLVRAIRTEPKRDEPPHTLQPVSPKASDLRLLLADPSGGQLVSHLEFSIPQRDPSRKLAYEVAFRLYLDNQTQTMAHYVVIDMSVTSDNDPFWIYDYENTPFLIDESPRPWQITLSKTYIQCYFEGGADFVCHSRVHQRLGLVKMLVPYDQPDTSVTFHYRTLAEGYKGQGSFTIALKSEGKG